MKKKGPTPGSRWAYAYELHPPQDRARLSEIKAVLDEERSTARVSPGQWEGRMIQEDRITHILVVSDGPDQDRVVNQRLEDELTRLDAGFSITRPVEIGDGNDPGSTEAERRRNEDNS